MIVQLDRESPRVVISSPRECLSHSKPSHRFVVVGAGRASDARTLVQEKLTSPIDECFMYSYLTKVEDSLIRCREFLFHKGETDIKPMSEEERAKLEWIASVVSERWREHFGPLGFTGSEDDMGAETDMAVPAPAYITPPGHEFSTYTRMIGGMKCKCGWSGQIEDWRKHQYDTFVADVAAALKGETDAKPADV